MVLIKRAAVRPAGAGTAAGKSEGSVPGARPGKRYGTEPTRLAFGGLISLGEQAIRTSQQLWGERAADELAHRKLKADIGRTLQGIEARLSEAEVIRSHAVAAVRAVGSAPNTVPSPADPSGPKPGAPSGKVRISQLAEEILASADAPPNEHGWRTHLARMIAVRLDGEGLRYKASSVERILRDLNINQTG